MLWFPHAKVLVGGNMLVLTAELFHCEIYKYIYLFTHKQRDMPPPPSHRIRTRKTNAACFYCRNESVVGGAKPEPS